MKSGDMVRRIERSGYTIILKNYSTKEFSSYFSNSDIALVLTTTENFYVKILINGSVGWVYDNAIEVIYHDPS